MTIRRILATLLCSLLLLPLQAVAATAFYYTSSPQSWVGHGETVLVTTDDAFEFSVSRGVSNAVSFSINDFRTNPDFGATRWWRLDFAAPDRAVLAPGSYLDATRYPFQAPGSPGLSFVGNGRGDNTLSGQFSILEAVYGLDGAVLSFAADFVQFDEKIESRWNIGSLRYNSSIALTTVPEPAGPILFLTTLGILLAVAARRRGPGATAGQAARV